MNAVSEQKKTNYLQIVKEPQLVAIRVKEGDPILGVVVMRHGNDLFVCTVKKAFWIHVKKTFSAPVGDNDRPFLKRLKQLLLEQYKDFYTDHTNQYGAYEEFLNDMGISNTTAISKITGEGLAQSIIDNYEASDSTSE